MPSAQVLAEQIATQQGVEIGERPASLSVTRQSVPLAGGQQERGPPRRSEPVDNELRLPPDIEAIRARGRLIVGQFSGYRDGFFMPADKPLLQGLPAVDDGTGREVVGHDIEIALRIASRLGVELELRRDQPSFSSIHKSVNRGEIDLGISKLTVTPERSLYVNFSDPYLTLRVGVLINRLREIESGRDGEGPYAILNREGATIAVQAGTSWIQFGHDLFPNATLVEFATMDDALAALLSGEALGFLNDEWNILVALNQRPEIALRAQLVILPDVRSSIAVAVPSHASHLLHFVNQILAVDHLQTTTDHLLERYFDQGAARQIANARARAVGGAAETVGLKWELVVVSLLLLISLYGWAMLALWGKRGAEEQG
jgi:ABC-type amino acid transport substrate-binding protein